MTVDKFINLAYNIFYGGCNDRYCRMTVHAGVNTFTFGVMDWRSDESLDIRILSEIIFRLGDIRSVLILGRKLRTRILCPYAVHGILFSGDLTYDEICRIRKLISTPTGMAIQDMYTFNFIREKTDKILKLGITNAGIALFMLYGHICTYNQNASIDIIAACSVSARTGIQELSKLQDTFDYVFKAQHHIENRTNFIIDTILSSVGEYDVIKK